MILSCLTLIYLQYLVLFISNGSVVWVVLSGANSMLKFCELTPIFKRSFWLSVNTAASWSEATFLYYYHLTRTLTLIFLTNAGPGSYLFHRPWTPYPGSKTSTHSLFRTGWLGQQLKPVLCMDMVPKRKLFTLYDTGLWWPLHVHTFATFNS